MAIFEDDVESGTLLTSDTPPGKWDSKTGTFSVESTIKHHGSYSAKMGADGSYLTKDLGAAYAEIYARFAVRFTALPWSQAYGINLTTLGKITNWNYALTMRLENIDGTNCKFGMQSGANSYAYGTTVAAIDTWYTVEIHRSTAGSQHLYVNGSQEVTFGTDYYDADRILWGGSAQLSAFPVYLDCLVTNQTYIGPEGAGGPTVKKGSCVPAMTALLTKFSSLKQTREPKFQPRTFPKFTPRSLI